MARTVIVQHNLCRVTAAVVGGLLFLTLLILFIFFIVHRVRKRDEGSYVLDDPTSLIPGQRRSATGYSKALMADHEFFA